MHFWFKTIIELFSTYVGVIPFIEKATKDGFLKDRIEHRLSKFYTTL